jgi:hypothetical protein
LLRLSQHFCPYLSLRLRLLSQDKSDAVAIASDQATEGIAVLIAKPQKQLGLGQMLIGCWQKPRPALGFGLLSKQIAQSVLRTSCAASLPATTTSVATVSLLNGRTTSAAAVCAVLRLRLSKYK